MKNAILQKSAYITKARSHTGFYANTFRADTCFRTPDFFPGLYYISPEPECPYLPRTKSVPSPSARDAKTALKKREIYDILSSDSY